MIETSEGSIMPAVLPVGTHFPETDQLDTYIGGNGSFDFGGNVPSYGMQEIIIVGQLLPAFINFSTQYVGFGEYEALVYSGDSTPSTSPSNGRCGDGTQSVNWGLIEYLEGNTTHGVVPNVNGKVIGHSGVTIASGFDLGSHNSNDLKVMGLSSTVMNKLTPYLGQQGSTALNYLNSHPLTITVAEAKEINSAAHSTALAKVAVAYDTALNQDGAFFKLPSMAQTTIASVSFQYGDLGKAAPAFWGDVVAKNWTAAVSELRNFHDDFSTRRNTEANNLQVGIDIGVLINGRLSECN